MSPTTTRADVPPSTREALARSRASATTSCPAASSARTRLLPSRPVAPVTNAFTSELPKVGSGRGRQRLAKVGEVVARAAGRLGLDEPADERLQQPRHRRIGCEALLDRDARARAFRSEAKLPAHVGVVARRRNALERDLVPAVAAVVGGVLHG